jgi:hypothetical protein
MARKMGKVLARKMGKVHLPSIGVPKVTNPDVSSIDRAMAIALRKAALLTQDKDRKGGYGKITKVF